MDEEEFFRLMGSRPFGTTDAFRWDAHSRRQTRLALTLGAALWGRTPGDLRRQLAAPHPDVPSGFDLADFRDLLQLAAQMSSAVLRLQELRGLSPSVLPPPVVVVGAQGFTEWEARCEIVRRAIEYLENRGR